MQPTQDQPPQYTVPVVQPHLAPPLQPDVREGYKSRSVKRLAMAQIILGCLAVGFQLWDFINSYVYAQVATGIWTGLFFILTGCVGTYSANRKTVCSIVSYMVMSILSSLLAISLLVFSSIYLGFYNSCYDSDWYCRHMTDYMRTISIFLYAMLLIISVAEGIVAVVSASLACHGCCCSTPNQSVLSYATPTQYVQGPNGQLMIVTGQQPNTMTNMAGPQILITANPGSYQAPGLPYQGNYQPQGFPTSPYMATVPTMPTQQPVPQPDSVQPPAYQQTVGEEAAGTQQPQVHQSAANGKTNDAYMEN